MITKVQFILIWLSKVCLSTLYRFCQKLNRRPFISGQYNNPPHPPTPVLQDFSSKVHQRCKKPGLALSAPLELHPTAAVRRSKLHLCFRFQESHQNWINWDFVYFHCLVVVGSFQNYQCQAFPSLNNLPWKSSLTCRIAYMTYMSVQPTYIAPELKSSLSSRISDQNANNTCLVTEQKTVQQCWMAREPVMRMVEGDSQSTRPRCNQESRKEENNKYKNTNTNTNTNDIQSTRQRCNLARFKKITKTNDSQSSRQGD